VHCRDVTAHLLAAEPDAAEPDGALVRAHVAGCAACATVARRVQRLDAILRATLVQEPPPALQQQLLALVQTGVVVQPRVGHWWDVVLFSSALWAVRPHTVLANAVAAVCVLLAGWQVFAWLGSLPALIGDVPYALQVLASSPSIGGLGDLQGLMWWLVAGALAWSVSESGPLHEWLFGPRSRTA
jgi:hypothetical protein